MDAFPDVTPALVQVFAETEGLAPEEVEKFVTYPIEAAMNGLPDLKEIRSVSNFGLSVVNIYFEDGTDIYFARQLVNERLQDGPGADPRGLRRAGDGPDHHGPGADPVLLRGGRDREAQPRGDARRSRTG